MQGTGPWSIEREYGPGEEQDNSSVWLAHVLRFSCQIISSSPFAPLPSPLPPHPPGYLSPSFSHTLPRNSTTATNSQHKNSSLPPPSPLTPQTPATKLEENTHTSPKLLRPLTNNPMPRLQINDLEPWKESPYNGQRLIRHIRALCAPDNQRRSIIARCARFAEREVAHVWEGGCERGERDAEGAGGFWGGGGGARADEVCEEELADRERLLGGVAVLVVPSVLGVGREGEDVRLRIPLVSHPPL